jgi:2-C-methyl-D-erythritol 4-phosphate cytidylyltransferase
MTAGERAVEAGAGDRDVEAIITAAGRGERMHRGPKAFVRLGATTLLERAVAAMQPFVARTIVAVPPDRVDATERLVGSATVRVVAGGARRTDSARALVGAATARWLLLHDVVHPFVTADLVQRVLDEARRTGAAAAARRNVDFLYALDGAPVAAPNTCVAIQKPVAFSREHALAGFRIVDERGITGDLSIVEIVALAGQPMAFVAGPGVNFKLTPADDLEFAQRLERPASG